MRPTFSIIFFTVISGCGYGLLFFAGLFAALGVVPRPMMLATLALGFVFTSAGLLSSLLHLGQPQRAWRALSQWRSSWLSREGVSSLITFVPMFSLAVLAWTDRHGWMSRLIGVVLALMCIVTVFCTARIYTSLKTIRAWHNAYVFPTYLMLGISSASAWLWLIGSTSDVEMIEIILRCQVVGLSAAAAAMTFDYWRFVDRDTTDSTPESATGLGRFGRVESFEAPHTEENYLTREMGFALARKHATKLRAISLALFAVAPALSVLLAFVMPASLRIVLAAVASLAAISGVFLSRWLFFAQAKHVVMLFYENRGRA